MHRYIYSVLIISAVFAVLEAIHPLKKNSFLPYVKFVMGLVLILVIASPLIGMVTSMDGVVTQIRAFFGSDTTESEEMQTDAILSETASHIASAIADILCEEYGMAREDIHIDVALDAENVGEIRIESVVIQTKELPPLLTSAYLSSYFSGLLGCDVAVN